MMSNKTFQNDPRTHINRMSKIPQEYYTCHVTGEHLHYTEFVLAKNGWFAIDGTRRHPISKVGKTNNQSLINGLRMNVDGKLVAISHSKHPHHEVHKKHIDAIRKENNYTLPWLRVDLTKIAYTRIYEELNVSLPNFEQLNTKGSRKSNGSDSCLDYLKIPNDRQHREVKIGKYFVDGLVEKLVIEYFGDYFHANPSFYEPDQKLFGGVVRDKWKKDEIRLNVIREKGYSVIKIWENDWNNFSQSKVDNLRIEYNNQEYYIKELIDIERVVTER
jgi:very-short-patch-repair endonuclease